uniref:Histone H2A n=1 Tax=Plectus sambesii TaxID=2011161 RepID=A0A914VT50_9BILA
MFNSGQMTIDQAQWRGMFIKSLYKVFQDNHPGIGVEQAVVERIEELVIRLLFELLDSRPVSTQDLEKRIQATFPAPINEWATVEAENAVKYTGKKHHSKMSAGSNKPMLSLVGKVHPMLRDHLGYKIDEKVTLYVISVLEYIASDIIKTTGNYVKNIRNTTATVQDLNIALRADKVSRDLRA